MSQRYFKYKHPKHGLIEIMAGWDRPLRYSFLVIRNDETMLYNNLDDPQGPDVPPERIAEVLESHGITPPARYIDDLEGDRRKNLGNYQQHYPMPETQPQNTA